MKDYNVLLRFDNGTETKQVVTADSANSSRWIGKKIDGVFEAVVLNTVTKLINKQLSLYALTIQ